MNKTIISKDRKEYLRKIKKRKYLKKSLKIFIILSILWVFAFYLYNTYKR